MMVMNAVDQKRLKKAVNLVMMQKGALTMNKGILYVIIGSALFSVSLYFITYLALTQLN